MKNISKTWLGVLVLLSVVAILAIIYNKAYLGTKATGIFTSPLTGNAVKRVSADVASSRIRIAGSTRAWLARLPLA